MTQVLVSEASLTSLLLTAIKHDLSTDFAGAMLRYQLCRGVAEVILSLQPTQISFLAKQSKNLHVLRLANGNSTKIWADLAKAVVNEDTTAVNLALVHSLLGGVPTALAA